MTTTGTAPQTRTADVIERYGNCLELVPMDPHFHNISVGAYVKDGICTIWSFSSRPGVDGRLRQIRDQICALGGLAAVEGSYHQVKYSCGHLHRRALKFLLAQAVGKSPDYSPVQGEMSIADTRTKLTIKVGGSEAASGWIYEVSSDGEADNIPLRLRMIVTGFLRYGEMEKVTDTQVAFPCTHRHDELVRLLLPYARNVSAVESMMEAESLRGQMTTGTLGFTPT